MSDQPDKGCFIETRGQAVVVIFVTLFLTGLRFWHIAHGHVRNSGWIYALNSWLPNWAAISANVLTYGFFVWFLGSVLLQWRGTERIIAAILIAEVLVSPSKQYVPVTVAEAIIWIQAFGELVMVMAAVHLYISRSEKEIGTSA